MLFPCFPLLCAACCFDPAMPFCPVIAPFCYRFMPLPRSLLSHCWPSMRSSQPTMPSRGLFASPTQTQGDPQSRATKTTMTMTAGQSRRDDNVCRGLFQLRGLSPLVSVVMSAQSEVWIRDLSEGGTVFVVRGVHPSPRRPGNSNCNGVEGESDLTAALPATKMTARMMTMTTKRGGRNDRGGAAGDQQPVGDAAKFPRHLNSIIFGREDNNDCGVDGHKDDSGNPICGSDDCVRLSEQQRKPASSVFKPSLPPYPLTPRGRSPV